jgi:hypothetical protein
MRKLQLFREVLRLHGTKQFYKCATKNFWTRMTLSYLLIIGFPKFDPLTAPGMALCVNLGPKCQNVFPSVSD